MEDIESMLTERGTADAVHLPPEGEWAATDR